MWEAIVKLLFQRIKKCYCFIVQCLRRFKKMKAAQDRHYTYYQTGHINHHLAAANLDRLNVNVNDNVDLAIGLTYILQKSGRADQ